MNRQYLKYSPEVGAPTANSHHGQQRRLQKQPECKAANLSDDHNAENLFSSGGACRRFSCLRYNCYKINISHGLLTMSHFTQLQFVQNVREFFPEKFKGVRVLEIGSQDINGSVRSLFTAARYVGLDVAEGPGVDVVCRGEEFNDPDNSYDVVISCEVMEHNPEWMRTFQNMVRLARPGALILMTCATAGRPEHGTSRTTPADSPFTLHWNYYKNLTEHDFKTSISLGQVFGVHQFFTYHYMSDLFFVGIKGAVAEVERSRFEQAMRRLSWRYAVRNVLHWRALSRMLLVRYLGMVFKTPCSPRWFEGPSRGTIAS